MKDSKRALTMRLPVLIALMLLLLIPGCRKETEATDGTEVNRGYIQITQEEAKSMMQQDDGHVVVDVRRRDEFDAGHIPGAILVPNESIGSEQPEALPDLDQIILIYCRSGNRSKQAAEKLSRIGYTKLYEFGGIIDWTGEIVQ